VASFVGNRHYRWTVSIVIHVVIGCIPFVPAGLGVVTFLPSRRQTLNLSNISWSPVRSDFLLLCGRLRASPLCLSRVSSSPSTELVPAVLRLFLRTHPVLCLSFLLEVIPCGFIFGNRHYRWTVGIVIHVVIGYTRCWPAGLGDDVPSAFSASVRALNLSNISWSPFVPRLSSSVCETVHIVPILL
jgi:hypothetical protein